MSSGRRIAFETIHMQQKSPTDGGWALVREGCLTMTYFRMGNPHYHRRAAVSRSCSGWEGVVPTGCGRQALNRPAVVSQKRQPHNGRWGRSKAGQIVSVTWQAPADFWIANT